MPNLEKRPKEVRDGYANMLRVFFFRVVRVFRGSRFGLRPVRLQA